MRNRNYTSAKKASLNQFLHQAMTPEFQESLKDHAAHLHTASKQRVKLVLSGMAERIQQESQAIKQDGKNHLLNLGEKAISRLSKKLHQVADDLEVKAVKIHQKIR